MGLKLGHLSDEQRLVEWRRIVNRMADEHVEQGWNHYMFRLLRGVFAKNPELSYEGGFIMAWIADNYVERALMLVRRELDKQNGVENLSNLLIDMMDHSHVLTRARHRETWDCEDTSDRAFADAAFNQFGFVKSAECPDKDHLDPAVVRRDLKAIQASSERLRRHAEQTRAHRTPEKSIDPGKITYGDLHKTIDEIREVVSRYYVLLTAACIAEWEPVAQFDVVGPFTKPWVARPESFRWDDEPVVEPGS